MYFKILVVGNLLYIVRCRFLVGFFSSGGNEYSAKRCRFPFFCKNFVDAPIDMVSMCGPIVSI